ncbi:MAG: PEP-CTERM sorting domain-containing protein [Fimbriimonadales bacterium]|nr:PEP-CTERM sorting domain-containing protein [Fimbriimonadales bacterium]
MNISKVLACFVLAGIVFGSATAQLWNQPPHTPGASGGNGLSGFFGVLGGSQYDRQLADDFQVPAPGWLVDTIVTNWVPFDNTTTIPVTEVRFAFYEKTSTGGVGALVTSGSATSFTQTSTSTMYFTRNERVFTATIPTVTLMPGEYFAHVQLVVDHNWFWLTSSPTNTWGSVAHLRRGPGAGAGVDPGWPTEWTPTTGAVFNAPYDLAFRLDGQVIPEPGTMLALGAGLALLAARRRRKNA